ncbi:MAG TPA: hypothetical protein VHK28_06345, partial [Candidatus Limnocylindria bacterium]|nr:hypothetical protein [Candidatus Limnocylindria bacterium]
HRPGAHQEQQLAALTPLYFAPTAGFIAETLDMTTDQAERVIDAQARTARRLLQRVLDFGDEEGVEIRTMVRIGRTA